MEGSRKRMKFALLLSVICLGGCFADFYTDKQDYETFGLQEEDLESPPSENEIRARILNDALRWRFVREMIDRVGRPDCDFVSYSDLGPVCSRDQSPLHVIVFPGDTSDRPDPIVETAYYCAQESLYVYHNKGGFRKRNHWLGPYRVTWNRGKKE